MKLLGAIFLTRRAFLIGWAVVLMLLAGWFWQPAFVYGKLALLLYVLAYAAEFYLLFGQRSGMKAQRR
ncbi:MAG TPA: hypothetical protein VKG92_10940, partial [Flavobacteriales bacterium]|nr:hypothetical protein [Flavobacteriales bacterium]